MTKEASTAQNEKTCHKTATTRLMRWLAFALDYNKQHEIADHLDLLDEKAVEWMFRDWDDVNQNSVAIHDLENFWLFSRNLRGKRGKIPRKCLGVGEVCSFNNAIIKSSKRS